MFTGFAQASINSYNNWGQVIDNFFLRGRLLSGKLQSLLCNYAIFAILTACKMLLAFTERYSFLAEQAGLLTFFGQTFLALVLRTYSQLWLPTDGVFFNKEPSG